MDALNLNQEDVAKELGVSQTIVSRIVNGVAPGRKHITRIAEFLRVNESWILRGEDPPPWYRHRVAEPSQPYDAGNGIAVVGVAAAGKPTEAAAWSEMRQDSLHLPDQWVAVEVTGSSAYPVAYPGQFVLIDTGRCITPGTWDTAGIQDLGDNVCLVVTNEGEKQSAYIKRLCVDPRAPDGFIFASVDSGRGSPYLPREIIDMIVPVVGVIFEDPRKPRLKGRNQATITI